MTTPEENKAITRCFSKVIESGDTSVFEDVVADCALDHYTPSRPNPLAYRPGRYRPRTSPG
jgi:hypothetical protein